VFDQPLANRSAISIIKVSCRYYAHGLSRNTQVWIFGSWAVRSGTWYVHHCRVDGWTWQPASTSPSPLRSTNHRWSTSL